MKTPEELAEVVIQNVERRHGPAGEPERGDLGRAIAAAIKADRREITSSPEAIATLTAHHGKPVLPIERYCEAFETWFKTFHEKYAAEAEADRARYAAANMAPPADKMLENRMWALRWVHLSIRKSNLLYRLIYKGEKFRTQPCPGGATHSLNKCGCDGTGWVREP